MRNFKPNQLLEVYWVDVVDDPAWSGEERMQERPQADCYSVGYFHHRDAEFLYLSGTITQTGERSKLTLPVGCIVTIHAVASGRELGRALWERKGRR